MPACLSSKRERSHLMLLEARMVVITKIRGRNPSFYAKKDGTQEIEVHPTLSAALPAGVSPSRILLGQTLDGFCVSVCFFSQKRHFAYNACKKIGPRLNTESFPPPTGGRGPRKMG